MNRLIREVLTSGGEKHYDRYECRQKKMIIPFGRKKSKKNLSKTLGT